MSPIVEISPETIMAKPIKLSTPKNINLTAFGLPLT